MLITLITLLILPDLQWGWSLAWGPPKIPLISKTSRYVKVRRFWDFLSRFDSASCSQAAGRFHPDQGVGQYPGFFIIYARIVFARAWKVSRCYNYFRARVKILDWKNHGRPSGGRLSAYHSSSSLSSATVFPNSLTTVRILLANYRRTSGMAKDETRKYPCRHLVANSWSIA